MTSRFVKIRGSAGCGKTAALLDIVRDYFDAGTRFDRVAYVSFTKQATKVAQDRARGAFNLPLAALPHFRTIHSTAYRALRVSKEQVMGPGKYIEFSKASGISLQDSKVLKEEETESTVTGTKRDYILLEQLYRSNKPSFDELTELYDHKEFFHYMTEITKFKRDRNYLDYTDMIEHYNNVEDVEVALIDEAQELSPLQWRMLMKAYSNAHTIYVAGDPMQNLYSFAGGSAATMDKIKGENRILDFSHRCGNNLVRMALRIMHRTNDIIHWDYSGRDEPTDIYEVRKLEQWYLPKEGTVYMLARTNCMLKPFIDFCLQRRIPFRLGKSPYVSKNDLVAYKAGTLDTKKKWYIDEIGIDTPARVLISTIHGVKGGEADHVVVSTETTRNIVRWMSKYDISRNTELRILYVAITRARKSLAIWLSDEDSNYNSIMQGVLDGGNK